MKTQKRIEVYRRDKKNYKKTYNIEFVAEYNVSEISISELKNILVCYWIITIGMITDIQLLLMHIFIYLIKMRFIYDGLKF